MFIPMHDDALKFETRLCATSGATSAASDAVRFRADAPSPRARRSRCFYCFTYDRDTVDI